jgi:hypothetical protein
LFAKTHRAMGPVFRPTSAAPDQAAPGANRGPKTELALVENVNRAKTPVR